MAKMKTLLEGEEFQKALKGALKKADEELIRLCSIPPVSASDVVDVEPLWSAADWRVPQGFCDAVLDGAKRNVSVGFRGELNPCGEITLKESFTCSLPFELEDEDTPEKAYDRAMQGIK